MTHDDFWCCCVVVAVVRCFVFSVVLGRHRDARRILVLVLVVMFSVLCLVLRWAVILTHDDF